MDLAAKYLDEIKRQLHGHKRLAESAMSQLNDEQFFTAIDPESNSVAIIVKHISGNAHSRFSDFLISDGEKPNRLRDREFEIDSSATRTDIMHYWEKGWAIVFATIDSLQPADIERTITIRQEPHTVMQALNRALAHYAQHTGQIVFLAKHLRSSQWETLSIPRGKSEEYKVARAGTNAAVIRTNRMRNDLAFVFMVFGSVEFRLHLFSPEPPRKVSGFLSEASQSFAVLRCLRLCSGQTPSAVTKETCCLSGSLLNHGMFSERSLLPRDHSSGMPDGA